MKMQTIEKIASGIRKLKNEVNFEKEEPIAVNRNGKWRIHGRLRMGNWNLEYNN